MDRPMRVIRAAISRTGRLLRWASLQQVRDHHRFGRVQPRTGAVEVAG